MSTIVVGVDGSACSDCAVRRAVELAAGLDDSLVLAYAVEPPFRSVGNEWREAQAALEEMGRPILDAAAATVAEPVSLPRSCSFPSGRPRRCSASRPSVTRG